MLRITESPVAHDGMVDTVDFYKVKINGVACPVHRARVSAMPFNRPWPGHQRPKNQTEIAAFISFESDESVTLEVECSKKFKKPIVRPLSKYIEPTAKGNVVTFSIRKKGQYVLELDDEHEALHIFFDDICDYAEKENATYYFGAGLHFPGLIRLKSNDSVYVDRGAVVYGSLYAESVENINIFGHGIIDGSYEERIVEHCYENYTKGNIKFYDSKNINIDGVILRDSAIWSLSLFNCEDVKINDIKIIGHWRYNTDGIDLCNCRNVTVENSFIRAFDDVITIKGIPRYWELPVYNIHIRNCVMWCGWGRNAEVGVETCAPEYRDISFEKCDLIHSSAVAIDIQNGGTAEIHDVLFSDINVEYSNKCMHEVLQKSDKMKYAPWVKLGVPYLIYSDNRRFHLKDDNGNQIHFPHAYTHDVLYRNIYVYLDEKVPMPKIHIKSHSHTAIHENFTIDGLYVNGIKIEDLNDFDYKTNDNVKNIVLK